MYKPHPIIGAKMDAIYTVKIDRVYGLSKSTRNWTHIDVVDILTSELAETYHEIEIGLIDYLGRFYTFKFSDHLSNLKNYTKTFGDWLDTQAGKVIPSLIAGLPVLNHAKTHYVNLAGRVVTAMCPRNTHHTQDFAMEDAVDVVLEASDEDNDTMIKHALFCVNGSWVHSKFDVSNIRLYGAGNLIKRMNNVNVAALSFTDLAEIKTTLFKDLDVSLLRDDIPHAQNTLILSGLEPSVNSTYVLSVCGTLFELEREWIFGEHGITVPVGRLDIVELMFNTRDRYDWSNIIDFDGNVNVSLLNSRETLMEVFKDESCFVVEIKNGNVSRVREELLTKMKVGHCKYPIDNDLGYITSSDRLTVNYFPIYSGKYWDLYFVEAVNDNQIRKTTGWQKNKLVTTKKDLLDPYEHKTYSMFNYYGRVAPYIEN